MTRSAKVPFERGQSDSREWEFVQCDPEPESQWVIVSGAGMGQWLRVANWHPNPPMNK